MPLGAFFETLSADVAREIAEMRARTQAESARLLEEARRRGEAGRERTLAAAASARTRQIGAAESAARAEAAAGDLRAKREVLQAVRARATASLATLDSPQLLERLLREVLEALGAEPARLLVAPAFESAARSLATPGITVDPDPSLAGAGVVAVAGARRLDDSLESRLDAAWPRLEPALARILFGEAP